MRPCLASWFRIRFIFGVGRSKIRRYKLHFISTSVFSIYGKIIMAFSCYVYILYVWSSCALKCFWYFWTFGRYPRICFKSHLADSRHTKIKKLVYSLATIKKTPLAKSQNTHKELRIHGLYFTLSTMSDDFKGTVFQKKRMGDNLRPRNNIVQH